MLEFMRGTIAVLLLIAASLWYFMSDRGSVPSADGTRTPSSESAGEQQAVPIKSATHTVALNEDDPTEDNQAIATPDADSADATDVAAADDASGWFIWLVKLALFLFLLGWLIWWLMRWMAGTAEPAQTGAGAPGMSRVDAELGNTFIQPPNRIDDLTKLDGIDAATAKRLNAAGIYQFDQLNDMSPSQRQALKRKFGLPSLELGKTSASSLTTPQQKSRAGGAVLEKNMKSDPTLGKVYATAPADPDDLASLEGIDKNAAARLNAAGIYKFDQLAKLTAPQRAALEQKCKLPKLDFGKWKLPALGAGVAALGGIGGAIASAASGAADTTKDAATGATKSVTSSLGSAASSIGRAGDSVGKANNPKIDAELGNVFTTPPADPDDLASLDGIDKDAAARLNAAGIYKFDQLAKMTADQQAALKQKCRLPKLDFGKWKLATPKRSLGSKAAALTGTAASTASAVSVDSRAPGRASSTKTEKKSHGIKSDAELGEIYLIPPTKRDDLTQLEGIDKDTASRLNQAGIYTFDQLNRMNPDQQSALKRRFRLPAIDFGKWSLAIPGLAAATAAVGGAATIAAKRTKSRAENNTETARPTLSTPPAKTAAKSEPISSFENDLSGSDDDAWDASTRIDLDFGEVFIHPPKGKHDLTQLPGIDHAAALKMNAAGIYKFEQLESLSPRQKASFKRRFGIAFGDWDESLKSLSQGTTTSPRGSSTKQGGSTDSSRRPIGFSARPTFAKDATSDANVAATETLRARVHTPGPREKDTARIDRELGFLYTSAPADRDDLTRLAGINATVAAKMNDAGIYKFDQLSDLNEQQESLLRSRFELGNVDFADWRRCMYAWGRGIETSAQVDHEYAAGKLHGISLPQLAKGVYDGEQLVAYPEQVVFRSANPEAWGRNVDDEDAKSLSSDAIRSDINYLRIRRCDTRESVVIPMTKSQLFTNGDPATTGWNGSAEMFSGGRHVGVFANELPQEVETKFSQGGWGFGHRYDHNDRQEWGWGGQVIQPTTFEVSVGRIGEVPGTVIFRSADPTLWNTRTRDGEYRMADPISTVRHPINFVRIMRESTGEGVIVSVDDILGDGGDRSCGWNGSNSHFAGSNHLGAYRVDLPQAVETRFGDGGWGFGHPFGAEDRQSWTWDGRELPETVFEISVLETVPEFLRHELITS